MERWVCETGWYADPTIRFAVAVCAGKLGAFAAWLHRLHREEIMLWTIFVILLVLWLLGLVSGYALGGFIHLLLVIAVILLVFQLLTGRRAIN